MIALAAVLIALLAIGAAAVIVYAATAVSGKSQETEETPADVPNTD